MNAVLNRGNLILGLAWALAIATFVNRAGKIDVQTGGAKAPRTRTVQVTVSAPAAADGAPVEVPVAAEPEGALSRNDSVRPLP